jgi:hypothetical protein
MSDASKKTSALNFRVPASFRERVDTLSRETGWTVSDIASLGLLAFWPEIDALVRASGSHPPQNPTLLREFIELCRAAEARGVDPKKTLTDALEAKLTADAAA